MKNVFFVLFVLSSLIVPSLAVLTDYQSGFQAGLKAGFTLGQNYQQMNDGKISINQYNQATASFNALIQSLFVGNQTALNMLLIPSASSVKNAAYPGIPTSGYNKPIHAIDASWNQSLTQHINPDLKGTIHGYDPDTYYTMVGWANSNLPNAPRDSNGNIIGSSLQPP